ncbi:MAG: hypothetical protein ACR2MX_06195, partial [Cyclobacteriaceae bacterium]
MEQIAYFFQMLKHNVVLSTILATGNFSEVDLSQVEHNIMTDQGMECRNFVLAEGDTFSLVHVTFSEQFGTMINFYTDRAQYMENSKYYFGKNTYVKSKKGMWGSKVGSKHLKFYELEPPLDVTLRNSSQYGYTVTLRFDKNLKEKHAQFTDAQLLELYTALCKFQDEQELERPVALAEYEILDVLDIMQKRNVLASLGTLIDHEDKAVRTKVAKHFLL